MKTTIIVNKRTLCSYCEIYHEMIALCYSVLSRYARRTEKKRDFCSHCSHLGTISFPGPARFRTQQLLKFILVLQTDVEPIYNRSKAWDKVTKYTFLTLLLTYSFVHFHITVIVRLIIANKKLRQQCSSVRLQIVVCFFLLDLLACDAQFFFSHSPSIQFPPVFVMCKEMTVCHVFDPPTLTFLLTAVS